VASTRKFVRIQVYDREATAGSFRESGECEGDLHNWIPAELGAGFLGSAAARAGSVLPNALAMIVTPCPDTRIPMSRRRKYRSPLAESRSALRSRVDEMLGGRAAVNSQILVALRPTAAPRRHSHDPGRL
jgi:hypothetical protein